MISRGRRIFRDVAGDPLLARALRLPTFGADGPVLLGRLTVVMNGGRVEKVFYPVLPPGESAGEVVASLPRNPVAARA